MRNSTQLNDGKLRLLTDAYDAYDLKPRDIAVDNIERGCCVLKDEIEIRRTQNRLPKRIRALATIWFIALILHRVIHFRIKAAGSSLAPPRVQRVGGALCPIQKQHPKLWHKHHN